MSTSTAAEREEGTALVCTLLNLKRTAGIPIPLPSSVYESVTDPVRYSHPLRSTPPRGNIPLALTRGHIHDSITEREERLGRERLSEEVCPPYSL